MGQWNPDVINNHYSSKILLRPIQKLAGYTTQQALYFCQRSVFEPDEMLIRLTPMGAWCIDALWDMEEKARNANVGNYQTAVHVLKFFCYVNKVLSRIQLQCQYSILIGWSRVPSSRSSQSAEAVCSSSSLTR